MAEEVVRELINARRKNKMPVILETSLAREVSPYYRNVPGGFKQVVKDALAAQEHRARMTDLWGLDYGLKDAPPWSSEDINKEVPVFRQREGWGYDKEETPINFPLRGGYFARPQEEYSSEIHMGLHDFPWGGDWNEKRLRHLLRQPSKSPEGAMPKYDTPLQARLGPSEEEVVPPKSYINEDQKTLEHELSHGAYKYKSGQWREPMPYPADSGVDRKWWDYFTEGNEMDPRLAEIKRAYSSATGKRMRTTADAEDAWQWWLKYMGEGSVGSWWDKKMWKAIDRQPLEKRKILQRMRELIQHQPGGLEQALIG